MKIVVELINCLFAWLTRTIFCCFFNKPESEAIHEKHHDHEWGRHAGEPPAGEKASTPAAYPTFDTAELEKREEERREHDQEHVREQRYNRLKGVVLTCAETARLAAASRSG